MKESFRDDLEVYTDILHESISSRATPELLEQQAETMHTNKEAEAKIFHIQKLKLEKLKKFKRWLEKTRGSEGFVHPSPEANLPLVQKNENGTYIVNGKEVTLGKIFGDLEWGKNYAFDTSVDIHDIRKWHLAKLKHELQSKLDEQIITSALADETEDTWKQEAYEAIGNRKTHPEEHVSRGEIAEKMAIAFLTELTVDDPEADFTIEPADAHRDVQEKIDFIIHRKAHAHGARVEESETAEHIEVRDIGIQFTTSTNLTEHKEGQIRRAKKQAKDVDDIVLVTIPMREAGALYYKWNEEGQPVGGPSQYWTPGYRAHIFCALMTHVLTPEEIDTFCLKHFGIKASEA